MRSRCRQRPKIRSHSSCALCTASAGLASPLQILKLWDADAGLGGPIKKDRVWFFINYRDEGSWQTVPGMFVNQNFESITTPVPNLAAPWTYVPDKGRGAAAYCLRVSTEVYNLAGQSLSQSFTVVVSEREGTRRPGPSSDPQTRAPSHQRHTSN